MILASVLLYSGLENPSWQIEGREARLLQSKIANLPKNNCTLEEPGLGYSGVELSFTVDDRRQDWIFYDGIAHNGEKCFKDAGRNIEKRLVALGRLELGTSIPNDLISES